MMPASLSQDRLELPDEETETLEAELGDAVLGDVAATSQSLTNLHVSGIREFASLDVQIPGQPNRIRASGLRSALPLPAPKGPRWRVKLRN